jgi:hypothetical protein
MLPPKTKFSGILNDLNLEVIDNNLIKELISRGIYKKNEEDWSSNLLTVGNSLELCHYLHFNSSNYTLNEEISDEIFEQLEFFIEHINCDFEWNKKKFLLKLNAYVDVNKKIKFLKKLHKKDFGELTKDHDVLIYFGQEENGFTSWKDYIIHSIDSSIIKEHLNDKILSYGTEILKTWSDYRSLKLLTDLYLNLINELESDSYQENTGKSKVKLSEPISIAMLHQIGFLELEKLKSLSDESKFKIAALILRKDYTSKNIIRQIRGNFNVLRDNYNENGIRFTAHSQVENIKDFLSKLS